MGEEVLIVKNITREGPGLISEVLDDLCVSYTLVDLDAGDPFPNPTAYAAVIVLGGPDSANDDTAKMNGELERVLQIVDQGIPFLGICLGLQVLVKATGGQVVRSPLKEVGFFDPRGENFSVELTKEGKQDPLFRGLDDSFKVFQLHGETVELAEGMVCLAQGRHCVSQVVKVKQKAYGIQCHFELTGDMLERWAREDEDLAQLSGDALLGEFENMRQEYTRVGKAMLKNFFYLSGF